MAYNKEDDNCYAMKILSKKKLKRKAGLFGKLCTCRVVVCTSPHLLHMVPTKLKTTLYFNEDGEVRENAIDFSS